MAQDTKKQLAKALKELMAQKPLAQVTVKDVTERCGIKRQTFYYHFQDIYDLVGWIYRTEAYEGIKEYISCTTWQQGFAQFLHYIIDNQAFCLNTYHSWETRQFERFVFDFAQALLGQVMTEMAQDVPLVRERDRQLLVHFYSYGFMGIVKEWLEDGCQQEPEDVVEQLSIILQGNFVQGLDKLRQQRSHGVLL